MSEVTFDDQTGTWLLRTPGSAYGLGIGDGGALLRHVYWGAPVVHDDIAVMAGRRPDPTIEHIVWGKEQPAEYVGWGGLRYDEPSLKVEFDDGTRGIEWEYESQRIESEASATTLTIALRDKVYPLTVQLYYRVFDDSDVIERWARLVHTGTDGPIVVQQAHSANWWLPREEQWRLRYLQGAHLLETQLTETVLTAGKLVLESRRGTTSHSENPWFAVDRQGQGGEESGEVWSGELAWSGSWKLVVETTPGGHLHVSGGYNDFDSPLVLAPGAEMVLPVFAGVYSDQGLGGVSRAWHAYQLGHVLPRAAGAPAHGRPALRPVLYNSWEATSFAVDEQGQAGLAEMAAEMGVELFVVDDGWFVGRNHDRAALGDWTVDPVKFPNGLDPLIEQVRGLGMRFGIWVEPEMVNPDSDLYRAHPDWVLHFSNRQQSLKRHQLILNLGRRDVTEWVHESIDRLVRDHDISFLKWDMNRHFSEPGWPDAVGDNPERAWVDHTRHLYEIIDRLRADHPGLEIESCSGGGGRVDLGILARTEQVWTSDNTDASDRIAIQEGFTYAYTPAAMMCWVTDSPNAITGRRLPLSYRFHVAMAGSLGVGGDLPAWSDAERAEAKELVAAYKAVRPVIQHGHLYRLASLRHGSMAASEYLADDGVDVAVLAWWRPRPLRAWPSQLRLVGLDPAATYRDVATGVVHRGGVLMHAGLDLPPTLEYHSLLWHLVRL
jgi:alpha-galactosidase